MKKVLVICAGGLSSSLIAKKTEEMLQAGNQEISITARGVSEGKKLIEAAAYDLYLVSPQTRNYLKQFQSIGYAVERKVVPIPPQAYVPVPAGIKKMTELVLRELD